MVNWTSTITPEGDVVPYSEIYLADALNYCVRKINASNYVSTYAGMCSSSGDTDGPLLSSLFNKLFHLRRGPGNSFLVALATKIKKITSTNGLLNLTL